MSSPIHSYLIPSGQAVEIAQGDLTKEHVDAIVNAANSRLAHAGGVAAAILNAGGDIIQAESDAWVEKNGPVTNAEPAYTGSGKLPCQYIIHAVGPIWGEGEEDRKLEEAVRGSLSLADILQISSLALPAISTGIYGFPKERAAKIILASLNEYFLENPKSGIHLVRLVLWDNESARIFQEEAERQLGSFASH